MAFARVYSADRNVSIFLGRPPRMSQQYCRFQIPGEAAVTVRVDSAHNSLSHLNWKEKAGFDYETETRWSAICAALKEKILDVNRVDQVDGLSSKLQSVRVSLPIDASLTRTA